MRWTIVGELRNTGSFMSVDEHGFDILILLVAHGKLQVGILDQPRPIRVEERVVIIASLLIGIKEHGVMNGGLS